MKPLAPALIIIGVFIAMTSRAVAAENDLTGLVSGLTSESFKIREDATRELWSSGDRAIAPLRKASMSDDPEMAFRAAEILEKLELHITPETPGEILDLIQRYKTAPQAQKMNFINELKRLKAYFQILKLYSAEKQPEVKAALTPALRGVAISGARESIVKDDFKTAIVLLEMSSSEPSDLMALASIYRSLGQLDSQLENPDPPENVPTDVWKISLLRAKGDLDGASKLAAIEGQPRMLAGLKVLTGDPTLWLQQNGHGDSNREARKGYIDIALKKWKGEKVQASDYEPLLRLLQSRDGDDRAHAMSSLASLGHLDAAEEAQAKDNISAGFEYYLSQERIPEALTLLELDPEKPDYAAWAQEKFNSIDKNADEEDGLQTATTHLALLASFLELKGLDRELSEAFGKPMKEFATENENQFIDFVGSLFMGRHSAPHFAASVGAEWAGEDENRWSEIFSAAFGEEDHVQQWRSWIVEIQPEISPAQTMEAMMAIFRMGADPNQLRTKWIDLAWKAVADAEDEKQPALVQRIMALAVSQADVINSLKAWDKLDPDARATSKWNAFDKYLTAAGRWQEAAEMLDEVGNNKASSSPELHSYLAANLRRAGREKEAAEHDAWAEKLALGYAPSCLWIASNYAYANDQKRALMWVERAAFQADPAGDEFTAVLGSYAMTMLEEGKWQLAASAYEALAQVNASQQYSEGSLLAFSKIRLSADLAKAMAVLPDDRERAVEMLGVIHRNFLADGVLADDFFPIIRKAGLIEERDLWFGESWKKISSVIAQYPESDNTLNTAAWLASRAGLRLDEAEKHLATALKRNPDQAAYLDTMAEVHFAKGDREAALKWSSRSLQFAPHEDMIRKQHDRFQEAPLP
ncbi:MAG: hypothetical protein H7Y36_11330 [Armatimonadetes bacterium]|nr:hypothetical protein [Akkermansiaceae bacterium]